MEWLQITILALIQGITEFLPVSSSAHLILPAQLTDWPDQGMAFDVALHLGTLGAVCLYFRQELGQFARSGWGLVRHQNRDEHSDLLLKVIAATVPVVVCGFLLENWVATELRSVAVIAGTTIGFGALLLVADYRRGAGTNVSWLQALAIGTAQMLAIVPGTSRSGITMTIALLLGLTRTTAARFSFLLSIPTIAGAALLMTVDLVQASEPAHWLDLASGGLIAFGSAYMCIQAFIGLVERTGMLPYALYRFVLGGALLIFLL